MIRGAKNGDVVLDVRDVKLDLGGAPVLDGVTFALVDRIREGRITGQIASVLGPSGAGKTRLLRLLAGLEEPASGSIRGVAGAPLTPGEVGLVFQDYPLLDHRTVRDNLELAGAIGGLGEKRRARAQELLDLVGLAHRADRYPAELSGGQRQRAAIARALIKRPALVIADEPTASLDSHTADQVMDLMRERCHAEGAAFVIATHDDRLTRRCDRVVRLLDGRIAETAYQGVAPAPERSAA